MRRVNRFWKLIGATVVTAMLVSSWPLQMTSAQDQNVKGKDRNELCDSCPDPANQPSILSRAPGPNPARPKSKALIPEEELLSSGGLTANGDDDDGGGTGGGGNNGGGSGSSSGGSNVFVNDPCLDPAPTAPFPENFRRTVQSETEIAVLNSVGGDDDDSDDDDGDRHHARKSSDDDDMMGVAGQAG